MTQTILLQLPDDKLQRYQRGAYAAKKRLEEFIVERLDEAIPSIAESPSSSVQEALNQLETLDDDVLWKVAQSKLSIEQQRSYDELLIKNSTGSLTSEEGEQLCLLGEEARQLTLKKAHAFMLLKWRGFTIPSIEDLMKAPGNTSGNGTN